MALYSVFTQYLNSDPEETVSGKIWKLQCVVSIEKDVVFPWS